MRGKWIILFCLGLLFISTSRSIAQDPEEVTCTGKIMNAEGKPINKAKVILYHNYSRWGLGNRIVEETKSTADGTFISKSPLDYSDTGRYPYGRDSYIIIASHPDYALSWININKGQEKSRYELTLTSPETFTITVTDQQDNPLSGARVWCYSMGDRESSNPTFRDYLSLPTDIGLVSATTDTQGKATVTNLPKTGCSFRATLKGYATTIAFPGQKTIRLTQGATLAGTVLTEDNKAVEGAIIRLRADWMWNFFLAKTDSQGRFRFEDLPANGWDMSAWGRGGVGNGGYSITMEHNDYTTWQTGVQLEPGEKLEDLMIDAYPGTLINCRVVETETNNPVGGARITGRNESGRIDGYSDSNGLFRIRVTPGQTSLRFYLPPQGVYLDEGMSMVREDLPESNLEFYAEGDEMDVTLKTPRIAGILTCVHGIVLGPDDKPQADAVVHAATGRFMRAKGGYIPPAGADVDGSFELKEVPAGRRISLYVITKDGMLAGTAECNVPAEPVKAPFIRIKLQDTKKTSVIIKDEMGFPLGNKNLQINPVVAGHHMPRAQRNAETDEQGLLEIDGIVPELQYYLRETRGESIAPTIARSNYIEPFEKTMVLVSSEAEATRQKVITGIQPEKKLTATLPNGVTVEEFGIYLSEKVIQDKHILMCFFDMEQRPSRNCIMQLNKKAQEFAAKDVVVVAVQASKIDKSSLDEWIKDQNISIPVGMIEANEEKTRFAWGIKSLPWLILTDTEHTVAAEGFGIDELDNKIEAVQK